MTDGSWRAPGSDHTRRTTAPKSFINAGVGAGEAARS